MKLFLKIRAKRNKFVILVLIALFLIGCVKLEEKNCFRAHDYETYDFYVYTGAIIICKKPYKKTEWGETIYAKFYEFDEDGFYFEDGTYFEGGGIYLVEGWEHPVINKLPKKYMEKDTIYAIIACDRASASARSVAIVSCIEEIDKMPFKYID